MSKNTIKALALSAIIFSVITISVVDFQDAEAAKASGTQIKKHGSATRDTVCGDQLCSEATGQQTLSMPDSEFHLLLDRMDKVHEKHQSQMMEKWKSMSYEQQAKMIEKMSKKVSKMESMDMTEHMSEMETMMKDGHHDKKTKKHSEHRYNETLNPRQVEYPNVLGFNDLHIHANRHLDVDRSHGYAEQLLKTTVHHHCKVYDDMTAACLLFPYGMTDQDKPYGIEYVITSEHYEELPDGEKQYWHYHKTEFPRAQATFPELTDKELVKVLPVLDETYGKVVYFWN